MAPPKDRVDTSLLWQDGAPRPLPTDDQDLAKRITKDPIEAFGGEWFTWLRARLELELPDLFESTTGAGCCRDPMAVCGCFADQVMALGDSDLILFYNFQEQAGQLIDRSGWGRDTQGFANQPLSSYGETTSPAAFPQPPDADCNLVEHLFEPLDQESADLGDASYFVLPSGAIEFGGNREFTIEMVVNPAADVATRAGLISCHDGTDGWKLTAVQGPAGELLPEFTRGADVLTVVTPDGIATGGGFWAHVAVVYDGSNLRIFVEGLEVASMAGSGGILPSAGPHYLGVDAGATNYSWDGWMAALVVWGRVCSASELFARYECTVFEE